MSAERRGRLRLYKQVGIENDFARQVNFDDVINTLASEKAR